MQVGVVVLFFDVCEWRNRIFLKIVEDIIELFFLSIIFYLYSPD